MTKIITPRPQKEIPWMAGMTALKAHHSVPALPAPSGGGRVNAGQRCGMGLHIEMIEAKAFIKFIKDYSLFKNEYLSVNIKLTLHKEMIRSVMSYTRGTW
jgi:hypothetical protein